MPFPTRVGVNRSGAGVPDALDAQLAVLPAEHPYSKEDNSPAIVAANAILKSRGNSPRLYQNTLVFLAAEKVRLQDLDEALRKYLAWESILVEKEALNLDPHQVRKAETQRQAAEGAVVARIPETYQWLIVPVQPAPQSAITCEATRVTGSDPLAVRASRKLRSDEAFVLSLGSTILRKHMDDVPLWRSDFVSVRQLVDDFARYPNLPRLADPQMLVQAIRDFYGSVKIDPTRVGRDASRIADEVIPNLAGQVGAEVIVTLEISARLPGGAPNSLCAS